MPHPAALMQQASQMRQQASALRAAATTLGAAMGSLERSSREANNYLNNLKETVKQADKLSASHLAANVASLQKYNQGIQKLKDSFNDKFPLSSSDVNVLHNINGRKVSSATIASGAVGAVGGVAVNASRKAAGLISGYGSKNKIPYNTVTSKNLFDKIGSFVYNSAIQVPTPLAIGSVGISSAGVGKFNPSNLAANLAGSKTVNNKYSPSISSTMVAQRLGNISVSQSIAISYAFNNFDVASSKLIKELTSNTKITAESLSIALAKDAIALSEFVTTSVEKSAIDKIIDWFENDAKRKEKIYSDFWPNISRIWNQEVTVPQDNILRKDATIAERKDGLLKLLIPGLGATSAFIQTLNELNKTSISSMYTAPAIDSFFKSCKEALKNDDLAAGLGSILFLPGAMIDKIISGVTGEQQAGFSRGFISNLLDMGNGIAQLVVNPLAAVSGLSLVASNPHTTLDNLLGQICESFNNSVINGTSEEAAEWFGYATVEAIGLLITGDEIAKSLKAPSAAAAAGLGDNLVDDAADTAKIIDKADDAANAAGNVVNNIDELDDAARAIDKIDEVSDLMSKGKTVDELLEMGYTVEDLLESGIQIDLIENSVEFAKYAEDIFAKFPADKAYVKPKHLSTTTGKARKFLGTTKSDAENILRKTMEKGKIIKTSYNGVTSNGTSSISYIIDATEQVGTKGETLVKVVLSEDGGMISAYPVI